MRLHSALGAVLGMVWSGSAVAQAATPSPAPTQGAPAPAQQPSPEGAEPGGSPAPASGPPAHYYVEPPAPGEATAAKAVPAPAAQGPAAAPAGIYEPPPPGYYGAPAVYEPPPPPEPRHEAPKYSLWLGGRVGWFIPFGNAWGTCAAYDAVYGDCLSADAVDWDEVAGSGPMFELDAGVRLARNYNLFLLWEHARLGSGDAFGEAQQGGDTNTDFYAVGLRVSSDADKLGLLTEIALGYRRFHAVFEDGSELQLTDAPFELRIGIGADIRLSPLASLTPLVTVGFGSYDDVTAVGGTGSSARRIVETAPPDLRATHGWVTFQLGGHFDLLGSRK